MVDVCFSKMEVVISQPWTEICRRKWFADGHWPSEESDSPNPKPEVKLRHSGRYLENR